MTSGWLLAMGSLVVLAGALLLAAVIAGGRLVQACAEERHARHARLLQPALLDLAAGEPSGESRRLLREAGRRDWSLIEPSALALLTSVTGRGRDEIIAVLGHRGTVSRAIDDLHARSAVRRARAADLLGAVGDRTAAPQLESLLDDHDADVRRVAARALGRIGDPGCVPALLEHVLGRARVPVGVLTLALRRVGKPALPALRAATADPRSPVRALAVDVLGKLGAVSSFATLNGLHRDDASLEVRISAARALGRLGTRAAVAALSRSVAWPEPWQLRAVAVRALGDIGEPGVLPLLLAALDDEVHWVAHNAAHALVRLGPPGIDALAVASNRPGPGAAHAREALAWAGTSAESGDGANEVAVLVGAPGAPG